MKKQMVQDVGLTCALTLAALAVLYPDQLVFHSRRFMMAHDTEIHLENLFAIISGFFQGGVQVYNRFDGMSNAYALMTSGVYNVINLILAGAYLVLSPLCNESGRLLHEIYSTGFYALAALLRVLGGYLLVRKYTVNRAAVVISLLYFNIFLCSFLFNRGMHVNNLYSYLPLVMYFIINLVEQFNLKDLGCLILSMSIAVADAPFFALSYFYVNVHAFLAGGAVLALWGLVRPLPRRKISAEVRGKASTAAVVLMLLTAVLILLPYWFCANDFKTDLFIANSGLNGTQGRLVGGGGLTKYFSFPRRSYANPLEFPIMCVDFSWTRWGSTWMFLGYSALFLALTGLVLSRQRLKVVVVVASALLFSLNVPSDPKNIFAAGHWVNALTNPFSFLDRSFHMAALQWNFMLLPFIALGVDALLALCRGDDSLIFRHRVGFLQGVLIGSAALYLNINPMPVREYVLMQTALALGLVFMLGAQWPWKYWAALALVIVIVGVDLIKLKTYVEADLDAQVHLLPQQYRGLMSADPQLVDYQNPKIFPQRTFYRLGGEAVSPPVQTNQNSFGAYYSYYPLVQRYVRPVDIYEPRAMAFKDFFDDPDNTAYLKRDGRVIFFAPYAMDEAKVKMGALLASGMDRQVVLLDGSAPGLFAPGATLAVQQPPSVVAQKFQLPFTDARILTKNGFVEYLLPLPSDFPRGVSTSVFTQDYTALEASIGGMKLKPAQGHLPGPFYFDVQNVKEGCLAVALPQGVDISGKTVDVILYHFDDMTRVWRNTHDVWEFTFKAPRNGWLVMHYPYDPKWRVRIDDKAVPVYRANRYYIAAAIPAGEHRVLLAYNPHTPVRWLLPLSALLSIAALLYVMWEGYRRDV